ncbi:hypothetical protein ONS95_013498 [Cadophora gregata]|uniref:uncharacterized protein n=1 Tax=Cadophora gregata TaxID=51156 RepID=UPI0026DC213D|nr:uncharacterized protein ONS95_013498 [Cadophora gregata]KAK0099605.1 hypothetical protein ONS96_008105 [Cadophora gregata f. sp. sojae]KAK0116484.1 hypothetical protein ONS95_013498 [Cadophora gregata]
MSSPSLQLGKIASPEDVEDVVPVVFSWNYLPRLPSFLVAQEWDFKVPIIAAASPHSFPINPKAAGLPYHTGLTCLRHNRHWRAALKYAAELCELLAADQSYNSATLSRGGNLASIAQRELRAPEGERFVTFAINLFPQADEERMKLIAVGILFVVIFDDSWEEAPGEELKAVQDDFVSRMRGQKPPGANTAGSPLQARIDEIVATCKACDERTGTDGGKDFIETMLEWVMHSQPESENFKTPREYLDYRWMDAANWWLVASCKFSTASAISLKDPLMEKIIRLVGDHVSIVNDLGSFEKELAAFESGRTVVHINLVKTMRTSCGLSIDDAKAAAFTLQLLNEQEILAECYRLEKDPSVTVDHWRFVDTLLLLIAGNTFYTMTTSRYGGQGARIQK